MPRGRDKSPRKRSYGWIRTPAATAHPTLLDIAWAAGIFEGEGTAGHYSNGSGAQVCVSQADLWLLERFKALFGSNIARKKDTFPIRNTRPIYRWTATGARARGFLMTVYGFLSPRRRAQVRRALGVL